MHNPKSGPRKAAKFPEVKLLIATLSIAVVLGIWNLLSYQAVEAEKAKQVPQSSPPVTDPGMNLDQAAELPTVVPLVELSSIPTAVPASPQANSGQVSAPKPSLRSVTIPTQVIVQKNKPIIDQPVQVIVTGGGGGGGATIGGGGGGGGGGAVSAPPPVTNTGSSRP